MPCDITVKGGQISQEETNAYLLHVRKKYGMMPKNMTIELDGDFVNLSYDFGQVPFQRIRRITGYLVGTLDRFNNAKRSEEQDRVKHNV